MPDRNQSNRQDLPSEEMARKSASEIPDDPESTQSMDPFIMQTQRGQGKEDGDPSKECDQPADE